MQVKNLITSVDFVGTLALPLANAGQTTNLDNVIASVQEQYLIKLLGTKEYNKLLSDLNVSFEPVTQKYIDLLEGTEFYVDDVPVFYGGFKKALPYFVYQKWFELNQTTLTQSGNKQQNGSSSQNAVAMLNQKIAANYNRGVGYYGRLTDDQYTASCYNYLNQHSDLFPDVFFTVIRNISAFGF